MFRALRGVPEGWQNGHRPREQHPNPAAPDASPRGGGHWVHFCLFPLSVFQSPHPSAVLSQIKALFFFFFFNYYFWMNSFLALLAYIQLK